MHDPSYITYAVGLIAILNPLGNTAIYIGMTAHLPSKVQHRCALHCSFAVFVILLLSIWFGQPMLSVFGISLGAFGSAGGIIVFLIALSMVRGQPHSPNYHTHIEGKAPAHSGSQIAVVPLAIPIIAGPGAISTVIAHGYLFQSAQDKALESGIALVITVGIGIILFFAPLVGKALGEYGMKVTTRVMGLILAAIAMQMLGSGLIGLFPGLA